MWTTFWLDIIVALAGAIFTVAIAVITFWLGSRQRELQAIRSLVGELHRRRALTEIVAPRRLRRARTLSDYAQAATSVLTMKDEIRRARDSSRSTPKLQEIFASMTRSCNRYLELSAGSPNQYLFLLQSLRQELAQDVRRLTEARRGVPNLAPGEGAF
jgi:hypothetical protein